MSGSITAGPLSTPTAVAGDVVVGQLIVDTFNIVLGFPTDVKIANAGSPISITDDDVFTIVGAWLADCLGGLIPIVRGQDNTVPEPQEDDWVEVTPGLRTRLGTTSWQYNDAAVAQLSPPYTVGSKTYTQPTQIDVQVDIHGPASSENTQIVLALFFTDDACTFFYNLNPDIAPLYSSEPRQIVFVNENDQFEDRWTLDLSIQANIDIVRPQQFAASVDITTYQE